MASSTETGIWMAVAGTWTTTADPERQMEVPPSHTFFTKHLSTVRAEEVLWVPGLVHCRKHFLEKEHTQRY